MTEKRLGYLKKREKIVSVNIYIKLFGGTWMQSRDVSEMTCWLHKLERKINQFNKQQNGETNSRTDRRCECLHKRHRTLWRSGQITFKSEYLQEKTTENGDNIFAFKISL